MSGFTLRLFLGQISDPSQPPSPDFGCIQVLSFTYLKQFQNKTYLPGNGYLQDYDFSNFGSIFPNSKFMFYSEIVYQVIELP